MGVVPTMDMQGAANAADLHTFLRLRQKPL
ncbi:hypothetical protein ACVINY_004042 [Sinorhizobium meliloti]